MPVSLLAQDLALLVTTACFQDTCDESGALMGLAVMSLANFQACSLPQGRYYLAIASKIDH